MPADFRIVGIGASAGGLEAYTELLRNLASTGQLAYVLVQHLDPTHRSLLTELLSKSTTLRVREVTDGMPATPDEILVIPPNCDLTIDQGLLRLTVRSKTGGPARTIDHFLRSLAADQGNKAIAVILSGAGSDGAEGLRAIKEAGGSTFAQDETTAKYDSMPRSATATGCVDFVLPPEKIARELARLVRRPAGLRDRSAANVRRRGGRKGREHARPFGDDGTDGVAMPEAPVDSHLRKIFLLLRSSTGVDFGHYRISTVRRRLARRLAMTKSTSLEVYARFLTRNPAEIDALHQDLLLHVTSFFRNPGMFEALKRRVFPKLVKNRDGSDPIRVWVAGCSTGQEAYSIAMAYAEYAQEHGPEVALQIFASDVNPAVLEVARAGRYTAAEVETIPKRRLKRFFAEDGDHFRVQKSIRDRVVFAQQNLLTHPPFTRVDLITCRNVLIYLEPALQQKIIPTFHYALKPGGYLVLGTSESVGQFGHLFEAREKKLRVFARKAAPSWSRLERPAMSPLLAALPVPAVVRDAQEFSVVDAQREADRVTLSKYAPPGVMVDEDGQILQFRGDVRRYLELPKSRASFQLYKMARGGLEFPLRRVLQRARKRHAPAAETETRLPGGQGGVEIQAVPLKGVKRPCFLILFQPLAPARPPARARGKGGRAEVSARRLADLKAEHTRTREHLSSLQEAHDTSVEELQSSNEEVQSANEELQSLNEELETSNEELESSNEELTTLNEELSTRNTELRESERRLREQVAERRAAEEALKASESCALAARNEVEVLNTVGRLIAAELDLEKLSQAVTDAATNLSGAEFGALFHLTGDEHGQRYSLFTFSGPSPAALARLPLPSPEMSSPLFDRQGPVRSDDLLSDPRFRQLAIDPDGSHGIPAVRSYLAVPVASRSGQVLGGLIFAHSRAAHFGTREERLVTGLAAQASIAMDNARMFDEMERKVEERTVRLRETIAELQAFSYTVSHDLRAPLRAMQSYAQVLKLDHGDKLQGDARNYLERIEKAGLRLDRLIQDVLTYSRMSQTAPPLTPVSLDKLIREIMEQYPMLQGVEGAVRVDGPLPEVLAEESLATQVLSNLLGNAVKFVPSDRSPRIRLRAEPSPGLVRLWVEDNGIGIPAKDQERIFKMFERVAHDRDYEGTGIGLAIVRRAVERMGGRVGVVSTVGEGSRFWVEFQAR